MQNLAAQNEQGGQGRSGSAADPGRGRKAAERAYDAIKTAILAREFEPGFHLTEALLAKRLGISRTPVREAFRRLGAEGWLQILPDQGVRVMGWSPRDIDELFEVRALLESHIARRAAQHITAAQIKRLRSLTQRMEATLDIDDGAALDERAAANSAFHMLLTEAAGNSRLQDILRVMLEIAAVRRSFQSYTDEEARRSLNHHFELIAALEAGNGDWAEAVMRSHILAARNAVIRSHRQRPAGDHGADPDGASVD